MFLGPGAFTTVHRSITCYPWSALLFEQLHCGLYVQVVLEQLHFKMSEREAAIFVSALSKEHESSLGGNCHFSLETSFMILKGFF